jgi:integrase
MRGTIRKLKNRKTTTWEVRVDVPKCGDGNRRRMSVSIKGPKMEADRKLRELITAFEEGAVLDSSKATVDSFLSYWLDTHSARVRSRTIYGYRNILARYVSAELGNTRLAKLQSQQLQNLFDKQINKGLSPTTVSQTYRVLNQAIKDAVRWHYITRNPLENIRPPKPRRTEMVALTADQLTTLLEATKDTEFGMVIFLAAYTGMRRSELVGLRWNDIDFDNNVISIQRVIIRVSGEGYKIEQPKSDKSRRRIEISENVVITLRQHHVTQLERRMRLGSIWQDGGWVFAQEDGRHLNPDDISRTFKKLRSDLGLPTARFHDLRHTHASLMLAAGEHLKVVQERLGHSTISITADIYSHVAPGMQRDAAKRFAATLERTIQSIKK